MHRLREIKENEGWETKSGCHFNARSIPIIPVLSCEPMKDENERRGQRRQGYLEG
jgi:hypothetical protein